MDENLRNPIFSVIIPNHNGLDLIKRAVASVPDIDSIEIIIVDNGIQKLSDSIFRYSRRNVKILYSEPDKGAGRARNIGILNSKGKWLLFLDSDDYYTPNAFDSFFSMVQSNHDIVFFKFTSVYSDTLKPASRGAYLNKLIDNFLLNKKKSEDHIRYNHISPCAKMISKDFVMGKEIFFEEIYASNDIMFSTKAGFYAKKISAIAEYVYCVTILRGSLTHESSFKNIESRYYATLRRNKFLKQEGKVEYQWSILYYILKANSYGFFFAIKFIKEAIKYRNSFFIGYKNWYKTYFSLKTRKKELNKYISNDELL